MNNKLIWCENKIWNFYFQNNAIYFRIIGENGQASQIAGDAYFDFDVISDNKNNIYIIFQDRDGSIIYLSYINRTWHKQVLLMSKTKTAYTKSFKLMMCSELLLTIYTIVKDAKPMLIFQYLNAASSPVVADYLSPAPRSFFAYPNENCDIDIYYQNSEGILGCKTYIWSKKEFGGFNDILKDANSPFAIGKNQIAAISNGRIVYIDNDSKTDLYNSYGSELYAPYCCILDGTKYFMWQQGNLIFHLKETENGFSIPSKFSSPFSIPVIYEIKSTPKDTVYMYGVQNNNNITLMSPGLPVSVNDFFAKKALKTDENGDKLDIILKKLNNIEKMMSSIAHFD